MKAMRVHEQGGSEKMIFEDIDNPQPGAGELLVKLDSCGVNFLDTYQRSGLYPMPLPFTPGNEAAGVVDAVGEGVSGFSVGDAVCYWGVIGAYAELAIVPAEKAIKCPDGINTDAAAAVLLQGMTAHYLSHDTYTLKSGDWCLVHAGAGGVGLLLIQMAKMLGANVISTVSTDEKAELAKSAGSDHVILYSRQDFEEETMKIVGDRKLDVVYDSVAQTTFEKGLNLLRRRGLMVLYGQSSGPVPALELNTLNGKGSLFVTRPSLVHHTFTREELENRAGAVLNMVSSGKLDVHIGSTFPLAEARAAHDALEGRKTTGKVLLKP